MNSLIRAAASAGVALGPVSLGSTSRSTNALTGPVCSSSRYSSSPLSVVKTNETPQALHDMIVADFETAWDAIAKIPANEPVGRGNFVFARQAMTLLEWASRLCHDDPTGAALRAFSSALDQIEARYF